ncbi:MAG: META domain-containing protein [Coriobacteriia bacterium]|nr:META domain-containing protein [Coriobacteriia bacterium]
MMDRSARIVASILLFAAVLALSACGAPDGSSAGDLTGGEWTLTGSSMSSTDMSATGITASFDGKRIMGFSGVNQYGGDYTATSAGVLKLGELSSTMMAGPEPLMQVESAYLALLKDCDGYRIDAGTLTLTTGGNDTLIFERAKTAELPGTGWTVTGYNNGKQAVTSVSIGSTLTVTFGTDGKVSGHAGVNSFSGTYEATDATVKVGALATTRMAGPPELMAEEAAFLKALEASTEWSISRGRLEMRDASGATQITADPTP